MLDTTNEQGSQINAIFGCESTALQHSSSSLCISWISWS
jgi:hypothetical protein